MNKLCLKKKVQVVSALVEGNSIRSTCRMTGTAKGTVLKLLVALGEACQKYQDKAMHNLPCKNLQCDEIWSFVYAKAINVPEEHNGELGYGDIWTFIAIDSDTKLVPCWHAGLRDPESAFEFMTDLSTRLAK